MNWPKNILIHECIPFNIGVFRGSFFYYIHMKRILTILFSILYLAVGFVSVYHAINFFAISNEGWLALILAIAFEIGQAAVLFSLLVNSVVY